MVRGGRGGLAGGAAKNCSKASNSSSNLATHVRHRSTVGRGEVRHHRCCPRRPGLVHRRGNPAGQRSADFVAVASGAQ